MEAFFEISFIMTVEVFLFKAPSARKVNERVNISVSIQAGG